MGVILLQIEPVRERKYTAHVFYRNIRHYPYCIIQRVPQIFPHHYIDKIQRTRYALKKDYEIDFP
jgi:hypothetical protein